LHTPRPPRTIDNLRIDLLSLPFRSLQPVESRRLKPRERFAIDDALRRLEDMRRGEEGRASVPSKEIPESPSSGACEAREARRVELLDRRLEPRRRRLAPPLAREDSRIMQRCERGGPRDADAAKPPNVSSRLGDPSRSAGSLRLRTCDGRSRQESARKHLECGDLGQERPADSRHRGNERGVYFPRTGAIQAELGLRVQVKIMLHEKAIGGELGLGFVEEPLRVVGAAVYESNQESRRALHVHHGVAIPALYRIAEHGRRGAAEARRAARHW
jgi:hypothetical protein